MALLPSPYRDPDIDTLLANGARTPYTNNGTQVYSSGSATTDFNNATYTIPEDCIIRITLMMGCGNTNTIDIYINNYWQDYVKAVLNEGTLYRTFVYRVKKNDIVKFKVTNNSGKTIYATATIQKFALN